MSQPLDEPKDRIWQQRRGRTPSAHEDAMGEALGGIFEGTALVSADRRLIAEIDRFG